MLERTLRKDRTEVSARTGAFSFISPHFRPRRHLMTARNYREEMITRFTVWKTVTGVSTMS